MRTDCNNPRVHFTPLGRQQLLAEFDGGAITSDAGAVLLRQVEQKLDLFRRMDAAIPDPRDPELIEHEQRTMLAQRVLAIACGWEDLNDHQGLRVDPLMQIITDRGADEDRPLASPSTLCRLENRVSRQSCIELSKLLVELYIESHPQPPQEIILDFDATDDLIHGRQQERFFHGYYDSYCFLPLYVFAGHQLLCAYLRPSNIDESKHAWAILALITRRLREVWPEVKIIFRGDSGFCRWRMLRWCDRHQVDYIVGLAKNSRLVQISQPLMKQAKEQFEKTGEKQRLFGEIHYAAGTWDRPRRVIQRIEHGDKGENPRFVVSSLAGEAQRLYEQDYCGRGEMENRIKEQQLDLFADRTSCNDFVANQFRLLLSSFAYVLIETLRRTALVGTELEKAQAGTIRTKLLKIGAVVVRSVRRLVLHLSSGYPLKELFVQVARKLAAPPCGT